MLVCQNCRTPIDPNQKFCRNCGAAASGSPMSAQTPDGPAETTMPLDAATLNSSAASSAPIKPAAPTASDAALVGAAANRSRQGEPLVGNLFAGRYRITALLGRGGMGAVYRAEHIKMNRPTAIKILAPEVADRIDVAARFQREAEIASRINHPNAVAIYDFGETENGLVYLAMEFLDGEPLSGLLHREGALSLERTLDIARQAAEALAAAHRLGIIHRDFKPENIMLCRQGNQSGIVKVVDFGIAKMQTASGQERLTQAGFAPGTPQYMSPEQAGGEPLDARSDLYSFALVVYEMLSAALPFSGDTPQNLMVKRLLEPPKPLSQTRPNLRLPSGVEQALMQALARQPRDRYDSVLSFVAALEKAASGQITPAPAQPRPAATIPQQPAASTLPPVGVVAALNQAPEPFYQAQPQVIVQKKSPGGLLAVIALLLVGLFGAGSYIVYQNFLAPQPTPITPDAVPAQSQTPPPSKPFTNQPMDTSTPVTLGPVSLKATATSTRPDFKGITYAATNVLDGNPETAWLEGKSGPGVGESLRVEFSREVVLTDAVIQPGYFKNAEIWAKNNRVARATFYFSNGSSKTFEFLDQMQPQTVNLSGIKTSYVKVTIDEVYFGVDPDTSISEIKFNWAP